ncbi:nitrile hydratase accessory protein [Alphaproteobacteria bacterium LSUCC0684]
MMPDQPVPPDDPEQKFEEAWHAQVFALTLHLHEAGIVNWPEWTAHFGRALAEAGEVSALDGGNDYYLIWVDALARLLVKKGHADDETLARISEEWALAYLETPHGRPVRLPGAG